MLKMVSVGQRKYDIIVFGGTGYTGKYVVEELAKISVEHNLKWAVAGRNVSKLKASLVEVQGFLADNEFVQNVGIVAADVEDESSVSRMCEKTRLVLNCVGPYHSYGDIVVRACIANGTHHVDLSGEFKYLEESQAKYFQDARRKGIYIVQACGYDSIPADLGTSVLKKKFGGQMESVNIFMKFASGPEGSGLNIGTWMSAVHSVGDFFQLPKIRQNLIQKVFPKEMPPYKQQLISSMPLSYYGGEKKWCLPLPAPDVPVIQRTQMFGCQFLDEKPIQEIQVFLCVSSFFRALGILLLSAIVGGLSLFSFGRSLLEKYPSFFSAGYCSSHGPSRKQVMNSSVVVTLHGSGSCRDSADSYDDDETVPLTVSSGGIKTLNLKISGPDPAYVLTSICMVHAGLVILEEPDSMPLEGGVLTPGAAFANTTLVSRLNDRGIKFEWIK